MTARSLGAEFSREARTTRTLLERLPSDRLGWRPHSKSFTAGELGAHLVECVGWLDLICSRDEVDIDPATFQPYRAASLEALLEAYDDKVARGARSLAALDDAGLAAPWRLKLRGKVRVERARIEAIRDFTLSHMIHHRGQLSVYLRLLEVPVPGAYGPTADEGG